MGCEDKGERYIFPDFQKIPEDIEKSGYVSFLPIQMKMEIWLIDENEKMFRVALNNRHIYGNNPQKHHLLSRRELPEVKDILIFPTSE